FLLDVGAGEDRQHPRRLLRGRDVDLPDIGMRMRRAKDIHPCRGLAQLRVVGIAAAASQEPGVLEPADRIADAKLRHDKPPFMAKVSNPVKRTTHSFLEQKPHGNRTPLKSAAARHEGLVPKMSQTDQYGHPLSGASAAARDHYERAVGLFRLYSGDPLAAAEAAIADSPDFPMAHLLKAWLNLLGTEPSGIEAARAAHLAAAPHCRTGREKGHLAAVGDLVEGRWHEASQAILRVGTDHPHDLLAL